MQYLSSWISLAFCHCPPSCRRHDQDMRTREGQRSAPPPQCCVCVYKSTKCDMCTYCVCTFHRTNVKCVTYMCMQLLVCMYVIPSVNRLVTCEIQICS